METAGAKERVVPALVQDDEPLDEGQGEDELPRRPEEARRAERQRYPENSRGPDGSCRQGAREIRRAQMLELDRTRPGRMHDSSFHDR